MSVPLFMYARSSMTTEPSDSYSGEIKGAVLLADDEVNFRRAAEVLFREQGYWCDAVPDAFAAAERLRTHSYDVAILDVRMPGNTALELAHDLTTAPEGPSVILITGYPTLMPDFDPTELPCTAYMLKPFTVQELMHEVHQVIRLRKTRRY